MEDYDVNMPGLSVLFSFGMIGKDGKPAYMVDFDTEGLDRIRERIKQEKERGGFDVDLEFKSSDRWLELIQLSSDDK